MRQRLASAIRAGRQAVRDFEAGQDGDAGERAIAALCIGIDADGVRNVVSQLGPNPDSPTPDRLTPVLITDCQDVDIFQIAGVVTEHLPARSDLPPRSSSAQAGLYVSRRLAILCRKWRLGELLLCGEQAAEVIELWRKSPAPPKEGIVFRTSTI